MRSSAAGRSWFRPGMWAKVWVPLLLVGSTIGLGWIGFYRYYQAMGAPISAWNALFFAAGLPLQETSAIAVDAGRIPPVLHIARFLGLFVVPYAFVLAFFALFGAVTRSLRVRSWSWAPDAGARGHSVVCGLGWKGHELVLDLIARGERVAVVERDPDNGLIPAVREVGAVVIPGDATRAPALRGVRAVAARGIFVMCGSDETNVRVVQQIASLAAARGGRRKGIECSVEIRDPRTREFVHRMLAAGGALSISSFDTYETTARQLLEAHPMDRFRIGDGPTEAHVVIIGDSPMGRAILKQCLLLGHFPPGRRLRLTVASEDPERARERFLREYPCFRADVFAGDAAAAALRRQVLPDCEFVELPDSDTLLLEERGAPLNAVSADTATSIYVCLDAGLRSAACVSALLPSLSAAAAAREADVHVFYYYNDPVAEHGPLVERNLRDLAPAVPVHAFDNFLEGCSADRLRGRPADDLAREIARSYRKEYGGGDWQQLSEADRMSNRRAADHVAVKLRAIGAAAVDAAADDPDFRFTEAEIGMLAEMEHRRWCAEKLLAGWRPLQRTPENAASWARNKTALKSQKLHLDLAPFDALDEWDRGKDRSQILGIPGFVRGLGRGLRRPDVAVERPPAGGFPAARSLLLEE